MLHSPPILFHKEMFIYFNQKILSEKVNRDSYSFRWVILLLTWNIFNISWNRLNERLKYFHLCLNNSLTAFYFTWFCSIYRRKKKWGKQFHLIYSHFSQLEWSILVFLETREQHIFKIYSLLLEPNIFFIFYWNIVDLLHYYNIRFTVQHGDSIFL